ncbi:MAG: TraB/GumN family protein [Saprospiraceae bacterium]|nr:TraB/GumN family protein [Saprospiraceae bacterium]
MYIKHYKGFITLFYLALSAFTIGCKSSQKAATANIPASLNQKALLWAVSGKDLKDTSYIFGTIHLIPSKDFFYPKGTERSMEVSEKLIFEIDVAEATDPNKMMGLMEKLVMKDDKTLKDLMTAKEYAMVEDHFNKNNIPLMFFDRLKPMITSTLISQELNPLTNNGNMTSYEIEFNKIAENAKKQTLGLETLDFQISIFDKIPYKKQAKLLVDAIKAIRAGGESSDEFSVMLDLYKKQDLPALGQFIEKSSLTEGKEMSDILLLDRNKAWIPKIINLASSSRCFFAVGAGHLPGPNGILMMLKSQGYQVNPVL